MTELKDYSQINNGESTCYKHLKSIEDCYAPTINLTIVSDDNLGWKLRIEPNDFFGRKNKFIIFWSARAGQEVGEIFYVKDSAITDYLFAAELVKFISLDFGLTFCGVELFSNEQAAAFVSVFNDYHKLLARQAVLVQENPQKEAE